MVLQLMDQMFRVLSEAQELRSQKSKWIGNELEWVVYEREVMLKAINAVRLQRGRPEVTIHEVMRKENCAAGHVDYSRKFALYSAELALELHE